MNKKTKKIVICVFVLVVLAGIGYFAIWGRKDGDDSISAREQSKSEGSKDTFSEKTSGGKRGAIVGEPNPVVNKKNKSESTQIEESDYISFPYEASEDELVIQSLDSYSGYYIEDGTEAEVENIAVIEVKNISEQTIEYAEIHLISDGEKLRFKVSLLPPGKSAIIMEADKKGYSSVTNCLYERSQRAYLSELNKMEDKVKMTTDKKGAVKITNISGKKIPELRIFYKNKLDSGEYIGGIAYTVKVENLEEGATQTVYPSHFHSKYSEVMMVRIYE